MPCIYKIINNINGKLYIGKTTSSIETRWSQHKWSSINRPDSIILYKAINKYGIENFSIEKIEDCDSFSLEEREKYWIKYYNTYEKGYNMTHGGDGILKYNRQKILDLWNQGYSQKEISQKIGCERHTIYKILNELNISKKETIKNKFGNAKKSVAMIDKNTNEIIKIFNSVTEASNYLNKKSGCSFISQVCNGKKKTAYGYKWEYIN